MLAQQQPSAARGKVDTVTRAVDEAKRSGKPQQIEVTFTEEELTSKVAQATPESDSGLAAQNTQIYLQGGSIVATASVTMSGMTMNVGVVAKPLVVNAKMQIVVTEIHTGALPIPDAIKQQLNAQVGSAVDPAKLVLEGTAKP